MDIRQVSDDFITIGNIAVLQRKTDNDVYDFDFRNHFDCKSVIIIEVNDAQESGFVGVNPLILWENTIEAMQNRNGIRH